MRTSNFQVFETKPPAERDPVVMLHCSASSAQQWRGLAARLDTAFHPISVNLCGHGGREAWHGDGPLTLAQEAEVIVNAVGDHRGPFHLIGHSYGGGVALRFALDHTTHLRSITLIEPSSFHILKKADGEAYLLDEIRAIANAVNQEIIRGDFYKAMEAFIDYWSGAGTWANLGREKQSHYARMAVHVAHHFWNLIEADTPLTAYAAIQVPTLVLCGTRSPKPSRAITRLLVETLPQAKHRTIRNAGHMSPITHKDDVNPLILDHLRRNSGSQGDAQRTPDDRAA